MKQTTRNSGRQESGNALFLILIAVALFAALSYAITSSGRGSGNITNEQALINAGQLTQYPAMVRAAATRMILTGTQASLLDLSQNPNNPVTAPQPTLLSNAVFSTSGGSVIWQNAPSNIGTATAWGWKAAPGLGGDFAAPQTGWFISGIGSDAATGKDIFGYLDGLSTAVCQQILKGLGLNSVVIRSEATTVDLSGASEGVAYDQTGGGNAASTAGNNAFSFNIWNTIALPDFPAANPQPFSCVSNNGGNLVYYHAVVEL